MNRSINNQKGFSAVEGLLLLIIVAVVGFIGYYVYNAQGKANDTLSSSTAAPDQAANPYSGWQTVKLQNPKVSFRYPASWKAGTATTSTDGDMVQLTGVNGYTLNVSYVSIGHPNLDYKPTVRYAKPLTYNGQKAYLDYLGGIPSQDADGLVYVVSLSKSASVALDTPMTGTFGVDINGSYADGKGKTVAAAKADVNFRDTALLINSIKVAKH